MPVESIDALADTNSGTLFDNGITFDSYDVLGNTIESWSPGPSAGTWSTETYSYNQLNEPISGVDSLGNEVTYKYDSDGNLDTTTSIPTNSWTTAPETSNYYNSNGTICASRDADEVAASGVLTSCSTTNDTYETYDTTAGDLYGDLLSVTDPNGDITSSYYDDDGNVCATQTPAGYVANGPLTNCPTTAEAGVSEILSINIYNSPTESNAPSDGPGGTTWSYFDLNDNSIASVSSPGSPGSCNPLTTTTCEYTSYSTYDPDGQLIVSVAPTASSGTTGPTTTSYYDPDGNNVASMPPGGPEQVATTSSIGTMVGTGSSGSSSSLCDATLTTAGAVSSVYCPPGSSYTTSDANGDVTATYSPNSTNADYDAVLAPDGTNTIISSSTYNPDGMVASSTSATSSSTTSTTSYTYDSNGNQLTSATIGGTGSGEVSTFSATAYNPDGSVCWSSPQQWTGSGNPTCATAPIGSGSQTTFDYYDSEGNLVAVSGPGSSPYESGNTSGCNPLTTTHCLDTTYYVFNGIGEQYQSIQPKDSSGNYPTTTSYYDIDGNQIATQGPAGNPGTCNPLTSSTCTDTTYRTFNANGQVTGVSYADLPTKICDPVSGVDTENVCYTYNMNGTRATMVDSTGTTSYTYDPEGRLISSTNGAGANDTWSYNSDGQLNCESYPNSSSDTCSSTGAGGTSPPNGDISFLYNADGTTSSLVTWTGVTLTYGYNCSGSVAWVSTGTASTTECSASTDSEPAAPAGSSAVTTSYGFDPTSGLQTSQATTASGGSTNLLSFAFGYDALGRLNSSTPTTNSTTLSTDSYGFDAVNRVNSGPIAGSGSTSYGYTPANGITADTNSFKTAGYSPSGELCWTSTSTGSSACSSTPSPETTFTYNTDEERTSVTPSSGNPESLSWNTTNQQLTCVNSDGTTCSTTSPTATTSLYTYNGDGLRQSATNQGTTNAFTWSAMTQQLLADSSHDYIYGADSTTPIMQIETSGYTTTPAVDLIVDDTNHNARGLVQLQGDTSSANNTLVNYTDYDAYGNPITESGGSANAGGLQGSSGTTEFTCAFGFGSSYSDSSNLDYLINRYYDAVTGQFLSLDPEVSNTMEPFSYSNDSPVNTSDPTGSIPLSQTCFGSKNSNGNPNYPGATQAMANLLSAGMYCFSPVAGGMLLTSNFHGIKANANVYKFWGEPNKYSVGYSIYIKGSGPALGKAMKSIRQKDGQLTLGNNQPIGPVTNSSSDAFYNAAMAANDALSINAGTPEYSMHNACGSNISQSSVSYNGTYPYCYVDSGYEEVQVFANAGTFTVGGLTASVSISLRAQNPGPGCGTTCQVDAANAYSAVMTADQIWSMFTDISGAPNAATALILGSNDLFQYWISQY
jgi:RHS repeat-associated protein